jgi:hypothetical protein
MTTEKIIDRVRKLYAHAESAQTIGNEAEALAFMAKVDELLTAHKLSRSVVEQGQEDDDELGREYLDAVDGSRKGRRVTWVEQLAAAVARAYFCEVVVIGGSNTLILVGRESDRQIASYVIQKLVRFAQAEESRQYRRALNKHGFRASFRTAFVLRVATRLRELRQTHEQDASTGSRYALVRQSSAVEIKAYLRNELHTQRGRAGRMSLRNAEGYDAGRATGDRADLGAGGVGQGSSGARRRALGA